MLPIPLTGKHSAYGSFPVTSSRSLFPSPQVSREQQLASLIRELSANRSGTGPSPPSCFNPLYMSHAAYPLTAMQARFLHLRQGSASIGSAVLQELQQRSFEAAELASFLRLHERAFGVQTQREAFQAQASSAADENRPVPSIVTSSSEDDCSTVTEVVECRSQPVCKSPKNAFFVLQTLGSTFRTKEDTYIDASRIKNPGLPKTARGGKHVFFPDKLYKCLGDLQAEGKEDIACFLNHGRAFVVSNPEQFEQEVMPKYFDSIKKWSSFTRQLYLWGFVRVSSGPDAGAFWHELFLDGHDQLLRYMRRVGAPQGAKEDRRKTKHRFGMDPDFHAMEPLLRCAAPVVDNHQ